MKKALLILLALVMLFPLAAGGSKEDGTTVRIGVFEPASGDNGAGGKQETLGIQYANSLAPTVDIDGTPLPEAILSAQLVYRLSESHVQTRR